MGVRRTIDIDIPEAFAPLFEPHRYKVAYGGRGGAKSWGFGRAIILQGTQRPLRVLCAREFQVSLADSVYYLLCEQIEAMGLSPFYKILKNTIVGRNGTQFVFKGLHFNASEIKSLEGIDVCWVEEAHSVSAESWALLLPTIRKEGSEIWVTFNPKDEHDPTYEKFVKNPPPGAWVQKVGWRDNPYFPEVLRAEKDHLMQVDYEEYLHVWEGECKRISDAVIFRGKFSVEEFTTPDGVRFYHGCDWGFSQDPTTLVRCYITDRILYIDAEAYGVGVELDEIPRLFDSIPTARRWPVKADNARPETISHIRRKGFNITPAKKWAGSVEDGVEFLRSFDKIIIHPRCVHTAEEFGKYSYKQDKLTGEALPIIVDAWNHCIDALRYALDGIIKGRTGMRFNPNNLKGGFR